MVVNFKTRGINRGTHKLTRTPILIKKISKIDRKKTLKKKFNLLENANHLYHW
jgi:hypothetical protein